MKLFVWWIFCLGLDFAAKCQEQRYGLKGKSIRLSPSSRNQTDSEIDVAWRRFNRKDLLSMNGKIPNRFKDKVSFNISDWSLTLKNLEENDTGIYEVLTNLEDHILAWYKLSVENAVSEPRISLSSSDFNSSSRPCRAVFNCSVDGSWAEYECVQSVCSQKRSSQSSVNITIAARETGVWCLANNHVSENRSKAPDVMCYEKQESDPNLSPPLVFWIIMAICTALFLVLFTSLITVFIKNRNASKVHPQSRDTDTLSEVKEHHETIYSTVQKPDAAQTPENPSDTTTIYDTPKRHATEACPVESVEVTSELQDPQRSPASDRMLKVTATVHQEAEADADQINTVYCKLGEI